MKTPAVDAFWKESVRLTGLSRKPDVRAHALGTDERAARADLRKPAMKFARALTGAVTAGPQAPAARWDASGGVALATRPKVASGLRLFAINVLPMSDALNLDHP